MKSSCIQHPAAQRLILIREWQVAFCQGDHCAAALLSFFEHGHNIKLDRCRQTSALNTLATRAGFPTAQEESLDQCHTAEQLQAGLLHLYGEKKIRQARQSLITKGVITEHTHPSPRLTFDKTLFFRFHPKVINAWLATYSPPPAPADGLNAYSPLPCPE